MWAARGAATFLAFLLGSLPGGHQHQLSTSCGSPCGQTKPILLLAASQCPQCVSLTANNLRVVKKSGIQTRLQRLFLAKVYFEVFKEKGFSRVQGGLFFLHFFMLPFIFASRPENGNTSQTSCRRHTTSQANSRSDKEREQWTMMAMLCLFNGQLMKYSVVKTAHGHGKQRTHQRRKKPSL